eukprot:scaffold40727_cov71-Phaeocystis_antarctica.AAC.2
MWIESDGPSGEHLPLLVVALCLGTGRARLPIHVGGIGKQAVRRRGSAGACVRRKRGGRRGGTP